MLLGHCFKTNCGHTFYTVVMAVSGHIYFRRIFYYGCLTVHYNKVDTSLLTFLSLEQRQNAYKVSERSIEAIKSYSRNHKMWPWKTNHSCTRKWPVRNVGWKFLNIASLALNDMPRSVGLLNTPTRGFAIRLFLYLFCICFVKYSLIKGWGGLSKMSKNVHNWIISIRSRFIWF